MNHVLSQPDTLQRSIKTRIALCCASMLTMTSFAIAEDDTASKMATSPQALPSIEYVQTDKFYAPKPVETDLLTFIYDVPTLPACGVLPPRHILNQALQTGGNLKTKSQDSSWKPFEITSQDYEKLVQQLNVTNPGDLRPKARFTEVKLERDVALDNYKSSDSWTKAACRKHKSKYISKLQTLIVSR